MKFFTVFSSSQLSIFLFQIRHMWPSYSMCTEGRTDSHHEHTTRFTEICVVPDIVHSVLYSMQHSPSAEANMFYVVKNFPAIYGTQKLITAVTIARHLSLS